MLDNGTASVLRSSRKKISTEGLGAKEAPKGLVLDLRNDPFVDRRHRRVCVFLPPDTLVVLPPTAARPTPATGSATPSE